MTNPQTPDTVPLAERVELRLGENSGGFLGVNLT